MKCTTSFLGIFLLLAVPAIVSAQTTWTGNGNNDNWFNNGNWDTLLAPNGTTVDVIIGAPSPTIASGSININSLTVGADGILSQSGTFQFGGTATTTLNNQGTINISGYTDFQVVRIVNNSGSINVNSTGNPTNLQMRSGGATLTGGGVITLSGGNAGINASVGTDVLTIDHQTIQGFGQFGRNSMRIANGANGLIDANVSTQLLNVDALGGMSNQGIMQASNGGILRILSSTVNNGGQINAMDGSEVRLQSSVVIGGTLNSFGTGKIVSTSTAYLEDLTINGTLETVGYTDTFIKGTISNAGTIDVLSTGNPNRLVVQTGDSTLTGGGTVRLNGSLTGIGGNANTVLTIGNQTVEGAGAIGQNAIGIVNSNSGLIDANVAGQVLTVDSSSLNVNNQGIMQASNGGILQILSSTVNNSSQINALDGSEVRLQNSTVIGGTLNSFGTGKMVTTGTVYLEDLTINSSLESTGYSDTYIKGTINNSGSVDFQSTGNPNRLLVQTGNSATLTGGGTMRLTGGNARMGGSGFLRIEDQTITGNGNLGNGTLHIETTAGSIIRGNLQIDSGLSGFVNHGQMIASTAEGPLRVLEHLTNKGVITADSPVTGTGMFVDRYFVNEVDGLIEGSGSIRADGFQGSFFDSVGTIAPGGFGTTGTLGFSPIDANSSQDSGLTGGEVWIDIASALDYDRLQFFGAGELSMLGFGADLKVSLLNGFVPDATDVFNVLGHTRNILGGFGNAPHQGTLMLADGSGTFDVTYTGFQGVQNIQLSNFQLSVPEPGGLAGLCGLSLVALLRRKKA